MEWILKAVFSLFILILGWFKPLPTAALADTPRSLARTADGLEIPGHAMAGILGNPLESIQVLALRAGDWVRIPAQVDEQRVVRASSGEPYLDYVFPQGIQATVDDDPAFDSDDLLVFLCGDLGDQAGEDSWWVSEGVPGYEIQVEDPRDGSRGWAYVLVSSASELPAPEDYVRYQPEESVLEARSYRIRLSQRNPILYEELVLRAGAAETNLGERNIIDRFKMRAEASLLVRFLRFRRNESDLHSRKVAWLDGPVRVVRRMETRVDLLWGFTTPVQVQDTIFYPDHFYFWVDLTTPIALRRVTPDARVRLSADLNEQGVGMLFVSRSNPSGFLVDGIMSEQEQQARAEGQDWYVLTDGADTLFSRVKIPEGVPVHLELEYVDDRSLRDPPESVSGRLGDAGYRLSGLASVGKGSYRMVIHSMIGGAYRTGAEEAFLGIIDQPLSWSCRPSGGRFKSGEGVDRGH